MHSSLNWVYALALLTLHVHRAIKSEYVLCKTTQELYLIAYTFSWFVTRPQRLAYIMLVLVERR